MRKSIYKLMAWILCLNMLIPQTSFTTYAATMPAVVSETSDVTDTGISETMTEASEGSEISEQQPSIEEPTQEVAPEDENVQEEETTPPESEESPAEGEQTPAESEETPAEGEQTPAGSEEVPAEGEAPEAPSAEDEITEDTELTVEGAETTEEELTVQETTAEALSICTKHNFEINIDDAEAGIPLWYSFTAPDAGEYLFFAGSYYNITLGLYQSMEDSEAIKEEPMVSGVDFIPLKKQMQADETVYLKVTGNGSWAYGNLFVCKKETIADYPVETPQINASSYDVTMSSTMLTSKYYYDSNMPDDCLLLFAYSKDPNADFSSLENAYFYGGYERKPELPEQIKTQKLSCTGDYVYVGNQKQYTLQTQVKGLQANVTYHYAVYIQKGHYTNTYSDNIRYATSYGLLTEGEFTTGAGVEQTKVAFKENGLTTDSGYAKYYAKAEFINPDNELIDEFGFIVTYDGSKEETYIPLESSAMKNNADHSGSFLLRKNYGRYKTCEITPYIKVFEGAEGTIKTLKGSTELLTVKDPENFPGKLSFEPLVGRGKLVYDFDLENIADDGFRLEYRLGSRSCVDSISPTDRDEPDGFKGEKDIYSDYFEDTDDYSLWVKLSNGEYREDEVIFFEDTLDGTPVTDRELTEEDIPDEALRALIKNKIGSDTITLEQVEKIVYLSGGWYELDSIGNILVKDLTGIENLKNLQSLSLPEHLITDITPLTGLQKLRTINLECNEITSLPDLSGLTQMEYFSVEDNRIPKSEFAESKFPKAYLDLLKERDESLISYQRGTPYLTMADTYYMNADGNADIYFELCDLRAGETWTITCEIAGQKETFTEEYINYMKAGGCYLDESITLKNLKPGTYPVKITATDEYGLYNIEKTASIVVSKAKQVSFFQTHLSSYDKSCYVNVVIPEEPSYDTVFTLNILDQEGNVVTSRKSNQGYNSIVLQDIYTNDLYPGVFEGYTSVEGYSLIDTELELTREYGKAWSGNYDLQIVCNGNTYLFEDYLVSAYKNTGIITKVERPQGFNGNSEEASSEISLIVYGEGVDFSQIAPTYFDQDGQAVTELIGYRPYGPDSALFELRPLDTYVSWRTYQIRFLLRDGSGEVAYIKGSLSSSGIQGEQRPYDEADGTVYFNPKTQKYYIDTNGMYVGKTINLKLSSNRPYLYDSYNGEPSNYGTIYATANVTLENGKTEFMFHTSSGEPFYPDKNKNYYWSFFIDYYAGMMRGGVENALYSGKLLYPGRNDGYYGSQRSIYLIKAPVYDPEPDTYSGSCSDDIPGYTAWFFEYGTTNLYGRIDVNQRGRHYFTLEELAPIKENDPELEKLYTVVFTVDNQYVDSDEGVLLSYYENNVLPQGLDFTCPQKDLSVGATERLTVAVYPSEAIQTVTFESSDPSVIKVDENGILTALKPGYATITVTTVNGLSIKRTYYVKDYKLTQSDICLNVGESQILYVTESGKTCKAIWTTEDLSVISVRNRSDYGYEITAQKEGSATITAQIDQIQLICQVQVVDELQEITLLGSTNTLIKDDSENGKDQLNVKFYPASKKVPLEDIAFESSDEDVLTVDEDGTVTAIGGGEATVTASVAADGKQFTASWTYTVLVPELAEPVEDDFYIHAFTNVHRTLADLSDKLPKKWQWKDETVALSQFAGMNEKTFGVTYTDPVTGKVYTDDVTVKLSTITEAYLVMEDNGEMVEASLPLGDTFEVSVEYGIIGESLDDLSEELELTTQIDFAPKAKTDVLSVQANDDENTFDLTAEKAGDTTLLLSILNYGEVIFSSTAKYKVVDTGKKGIAQMEICLVDEFGDEIEKEDDLYVVEKGQTIYLENRTLKDDGSLYKVSYKVNDSAVAKVGKASKTEPEKTQLIAVKSGRCMITATADDTMKSTKELAVKVLDYSKDSIVINTKVVTIDIAKQDHTAYVYVDNGFEGEMINAEIEGIDTALARLTDDEGVIEIESEEAGKGTLVVTYAELAEDVTFPLQIKIMNKKPSLTVKQMQKYHELYEDQNAEYKLSSEQGAVEEVLISDLEDDAYAFDKEESKLILYDAPEKKYTIEAYIEGYTDPVVQSITVEKETAKYQLSATSGIYYYGVIDAQGIYVSLINASTGLPVSLEQIEEITVTSANGYEYHTSGLEIEDATQIYISTDDTIGSKGDKITLNFEVDGFRKIISLPFTIKTADIKKAALQFSVKSAILYNYKGMVSGTDVGVTLKGLGLVPWILDDIRIEEVVAKNKTGVLGTSLSAEFEDYTIKFRKTDETLSAGSYKIKVTAGENRIEKPLTTTLTLKVIDVDMSNQKKCAKVQASAKGSIDILDRANTALTVTPKFTNVDKNAEVKKITLTGRDSHLFEITKRTGNVITVALKDDVNVITKYNYQLAVEYVLESGITSLTLTSAPMKIVFKQNKPKVTVTGAGVYSGTTEETKDVSFVLTNKNKLVIDVQKIELTNYTKDFIYDEENGTLTHRFTGQTAKGKSYTLKFNVYPKGGADNERPVTASYKVTIMK